MAVMTRLVSESSLRQKRVALVTRHFVALNDDKCHRSASKDAWSLPPGCSTPTSPVNPTLSSCVASCCPKAETTSRCVLMTRSSFCDVFRGDETGLCNIKRRWSIFWDGWSLFWDKNQHFGTDGQNYGTDGQYFGITCTKTYLKF